MAAGGTSSKTKSSSVLVIDSIIERRAYVTVVAGVLNKSPSMRSRGCRKMLSGKPLVAQKVRNALIVRKYLATQGLLQTSPMY
jgi:hypothetical protein